MIKFENKQNGRFYYLIQHRDLFSDMVLTVIRGGYQSRVIRHYGYENQELMNREIARISKIRISHGYELVT